jgi:hypothetical protein
MKIYAENRTISSVMIFFMILAHLSFAVIADDDSGDDGVPDNAVPSPVTIIAKATFDEVDRALNQFKNASAALDSSLLINYAKSLFEQNVNNGLMEPEDKDFFVNELNQISVFNFPILEIASGSTTPPAIPLDQESQINLFKDRLGEVFTKQPPKFCRNEQGLCSSDENCCTGLKCFRPAKTQLNPSNQCTQLGLACTADSNCCSLLCDKRSKTCAPKQICTKPLEIGSVCQMGNSLCQSPSVCKKYYTILPFTSGGLAWFFSFGGPARNESGRIVVEKDNKCQQNGIQCKSNSQCCSKFCNSKLGKCQSVLTDSEGNSCQMNKTNCTKDTDCCSKFCPTDSKVCSVLFKCLNCTDRGGSPTSDKLCCAGLYPNRENICVPETPPATTFILKIKTLISTLADVVIGSVQAAPGVINPNYTPEKIATICNYEYLDIKTQAEVFLNSFEYIFASGQLDDRFEGSPSNEPGANEDKVFCRGSSSNTNCLMRWEFNYKSSLIAKEYKKIRNERDIAVKEKIQNLTNACIETYTGGRKDNADGKNYRKFIISHLNAIRKTIRDNYIAYKVRLGPNLHYLYQSSKNARWNDITWDVRQYRTPRSCRDFVSYGLSEYFMNIPILTPIYDFQRGLIVGALTFIATGGSTEVWEAAVANLGESFQDLWSGTPTISLFNQVLMKPRRSCVDMGRSYWNIRICFGIFGCIRIPIGFCNQFLCTENHVANNPVCGRKIPNNVCMKSIYDFTYNDQKLFLIDPAIPKGIEETSSNQNGFMPLKMNHSTKDYAERIESLLSPFVNPNSLTFAKIDRSLLGLTTEPIHLEKSGKPFIKRFYDHAKQYAIEQKFFKEGDEENLENFAAYTYDMHLVFRSSSPESQYPPPNLPDYYQIAYELIDALDTRGQKGILKALDQHILQIEDYNNDILNELGKNGGASVEEGEVTDTSKRSGSPKDSKVNQLKGVNFNPSSIVNTQPVDIVKPGEEEFNNLEAKSTDNDTSSLGGKNAAAIRAREEERQKDLADFNSKVDGESREVQNMIALRKKLKRTMGGFNHFGPSLGNKMGKNSAFNSRGDNFSLLDDESEDGKNKGSDQSQSGNSNTNNNSSDKTSNQSANADDKNLKKSSFNMSEIMERLKNSMAKNKNSLGKDENKNPGNGSNEALTSLSEEETQEVLQALEKNKGGKRNSLEDQNIFKMISRAYVKRAFPVLLKAKKKVSEPPK